jgi:hypothetical protein
VVTTMRSWSLQRVSGGWRLPIEARGVSRCSVDHAFALEFHDGEQSTIVRIEGEFTVFDHGRTYRLTPSVPMELGPAVALFGQVVCSAWASAEGKLEIVFEDGRTVCVEPDARYEAWEIYGPGGMRAVCTPGGAISIWQPQDDPTPSTRH